MPGLRRTLVLPTVLLAALAAAALALIAGDFAIQARRLEREVDGVRAANGLVQRVRVSLAEVHQLVLRNALSPDERRVAEIREQEDDVGALLGRIEATLEGGRGRRLFALLDAALSEWRRGRDELLAAADAGDADRLDRAVLRWDVAVAGVRALLDDVDGYGLRQLDRAVADARDRRLRSLLLLLAVLAISAAIAAGYAAYVSRKVVGPLRSIAAAAEQIGRTEAPVDVPGASRRDEIGVVARALTSATGDLVRANARLAESLRIRDEFLSIASHELKTPLTPLKLHLEAAARQLTADGDAPRWLPVAQRQVQRLEWLVAQLLDVTRMRAGRLELRARDVDLGALVRSVAERWAPELARVGISVDLDVAPGIVGRWDPERLDQVVGNLLENAAKYAPGAPVRVRVARQRALAQLTVTDAGPGFPRELRERLFERFERAHDNSVSGLGLGLYIVKQIVVAHAGRVWADCPDGGGAMFHVDLPIEEPAGSGPVVNAG